MGPDDQLISFKSGAMPQAPLVPNPKAEPKRHVCAGECPPKGRSPSTTCALGSVNPKVEPERHLCAGSVKPKCRSPSATWTQGLYPTPRQEPSATCPHVVFL
ncbi:hypothetical protein BDE02_08G199400 [Populus trichocarpa]|nr:hypothetical protein BDE02_08G199400 [Populus trichocarpa]